MQNRIYTEWMCVKTRAPPFSNEENALKKHHSLIDFYLIQNFLNLDQIKMKDKMHKRRRLAEMAASTIAILVSPVTKTKGGGPHVLLFFI